MPQYRSSLAQVLSLVDPKTGVIRDVQLFRNVAEDPLVHCAVATPASLGPILGFDFENRGAACALDEAGAVLRACGETIERYSSAFIAHHRVVRTSAGQLQRDGSCIIEGNRFYPFTDAQYAASDFPYVAPRPDAEKYWTVATRLRDDAPVFVPASCVFLPYTFPDEYVTHAPISTGMAAGLNRDECLEKGAAEIVERDALMIRWKCLMQAPAIEATTLADADPQLGRLIASTAHLRGRWLFNLLTLDIEIPVVSAAFINDEGLPLTSFGIASASCPLVAAASAVREALLSRFLLNRTSLTAPTPGDWPNEFRTLRDHLFGHAVSVELRDRFFDLFGTVPTLDAAGLKARFGAGHSVISALIEAGLEVLYADLTSADVRAAGIEVWRVLVPDAEPLDNDHAYQHLGGRRLDRFREQEALAAFNPAPHPFP